MSSETQRLPLPLLLQQLLLHELLNLKQFFNDENLNVL